MVPAVEVVELAARSSTILATRTIRSSSEGTVRPRGSSGAAVTPARRMMSSVPKGHRTHFTDDRIAVAEIGQRLNIGAT